MTELNDSRKSILDKLSSTDRKVIRAMGNLLLVLGTACSLSGADHQPTPEVTIPGDSLTIIYDKDAVDQPLLQQQLQVIKRQSGDVNCVPELVTFKASDNIDAGKVVGALASANTAIPPYSESIGLCRNQKGDSSVVIRRNSLGKEYVFSGGSSPVKTISVNGREGSWGYDTNSDGILEPIFEVNGNTLLVYGMDNNVYSFDHRPNVRDMVGDIIDQFLSGGVAQAAEPSATPFQLSTPTERAAFASQIPTVILKEATATASQIPVTSTLEPTVEPTSTSTEDPKLNEIAAIEKNVADFFANYKKYEDTSDPMFFSDFDGKVIGIDYLRVYDIDIPKGTAQAGFTTPILLGIYNNNATTNLILGGLNSKKAPIVWAGTIGYSSESGKASRILLSSLISSAGNHVRTNHTGTFSWYGIDKLAAQLEPHIGQPILVEPTITHLDPGAIEPDGTLNHYPADLTSIYLKLQSSEVVQPLFDAYKNTGTGTDPIYVIKNADQLDSLLNLTFLPLFSQVMTTVRPEDNH